MSKNKKMNELNVKEKMEVLEFAATHSERETARKFLISKTTVNNIKKRKAEITQRYSEESHDQQRKRRTTEFDEINRRVLTWFHKMKSVNGKISGPMLQRAAMKIAEHLNLPRFKASNGWLEAFKKRNGISQKVLSGNSNSVDLEIVENFRKKLPEVCEDFSAADVFSVGECSLFFRALPDQTLAIRRGTCKGGKVSKQRLTVLLAVSAAGEKLKPLVIGASTQPRSFRNVKIANLPVLWSASKRALMTPDLFTEWLNLVNNQMISEKRKIILFLENCPVHPKLYLSNIRLQFLPPNTTALLQPLNLGILRNFKFLYRNFLLSTVVARTGDGKSITDIAASINVLQSVLWISEAWNGVKTEKISSCFHRAGFNFMPEANVIKHQGEIEEASPQNHSMEDFVACDDRVSCWQTSSEEVLGSVLQETESQESDDDYDEDDLVPLSELHCLTFTEVSTMMDKIVSFAAAKFPDILLPISVAKNRLSEEICKAQLNSVKQNTIDQYLKTKI